MIEHYVLVFLASYFGVALKAMQQLNVIHDKWWFIPPTSYGLAVSEVLLIYTVADYGLGWIVLWIGTGGWLGAFTSMVLHRRLRR